MNDKFVDMPKCMVDKYETADFIASDPVQFPRRYSGRDAEVSGFITSWLSFGNRKAIIGAAERMDREFLNKMNIKHCDLYDKGMKRIGCILCPMSSIGEMMKYPFDYPHQAKKFLNEIEILVKDGHYQELGENPNMVLAWYLSKRTVDDFKGLVRRVQSGKFKPNKKNRELWDRFIDYFDIKNAKF